MRTGNFEDYVCLDDENEIEVYVEWEGYVDRGDQWTPPWSEMDLTKVEPIGEWPEGLTQQEFDATVKRSTDRLLETAWENFHEECDHAE